MPLLLQHLLHQSVLKQISLRFQFHHLAVQQDHLPLPLNKVLLLTQSLKVPLHIQSILQYYLLVLVQQLLVEKDDPPAKTQKPSVGKPPKLSRHLPLKLITETYNSLFCL